MSSLENFQVVSELSKLENHFVQATKGLNNTEILEIIESMSQRDADILMLFTKKEGSVVSSLLNANVSDKHSVCYVYHCVRRLETKVLRQRMHRLEEWECLQEMPIEDFPFSPTANKVIPHLKERYQLEKIGDLNPKHIMCLVDRLEKEKNPRNQRILQSFFEDLRSFGHPDIRFFIREIDELRLST